MSEQPRTHDTGVPRSSSMTGMPYDMNQTSSKKDQTGASDGTGRDIVADYIANQLGQYRRKLLDLSTRNRLISFKHDPKARHHVRIVDEVPDLVFERLVAGRSFRIDPLPVPKEDPEDEDTAAFRKALDQHKAEDPVYREELDSLTRQKASEQRFAKLERRARDRVRHQLGLPPWVPETELSPAELARRYDINPDFDLPRESDPRAGDRHVDDALQTLHSAEMLSSKLRGLLDHARSSVREMGIGTLFAAFGFLEWSDGTRGDGKRHLAPLILLPVQLSRRQERNRYRYFVAGVDAEPALNLSLERLLRQQKHGLALPPLGADETPAAYFDRLTQVLAQTRPDWTIRRYVTIGVFPFSKLALYEDLDIEGWPDRQCFLGHDAIARLLASAGDADSAVAPDYDIDRLDGPGPPLVFEADSSQISAIVDAMVGRNLAVHGPPGTGKSQTIANMIATLLDAGKSVLFVAEKQAALDVVAHRLKSAGLGDFCLNLHAHTQRKSEVYAELARRLNLTPAGSAETTHQRTRATWHDERDALDRYARIIGRPIGNSGWRVYDVLWQHLHLSRTETRTVLGDIRIDAPQACLETERVSLHEQLDALEAAYANCFDIASGQSLSPWTGTTRSHGSPLDLHTARRLAEDWLTALDPLLTATAALQAPISTDDTEPSTVTREKLSQLATVLETLPGVPAARLLASFPDATVPDTRRHLLTLAAALRDRRRADQAFATTGLAPPEAATLTVLHDEVRALAADATTRAALDRAREKADAVITALATLQSVQSRLLDLIGLPEGPDKAPPDRLLPDLLTAARLIVDVSRDALLARTDARVAESNWRAFGQAISRCRQLAARRATLVFLPDATRSLDARSARRHARALREASAFSFLNRDIKDAKAVYRDLAAGGRSGTPREMAAEFDDLAACLEDAESLQADGHLLALLGAAASGAEADLTPLADLLAWLQQVQQSLPGIDPVRRRLRETLFRGEMALLDELRVTADQLQQACTNVGLTEPVDRHSFTDLETSAQERRDRLTALATKLEALPIDAEAPLVDRLADLTALAERRADANRQLTAAEASVVAALESLLADAEAPADAANPTAHDPELALLAALEAADLDAETAAGLLHAVVGASQTPSALADDLRARLAEEDAAWVALRDHLAIDDTAFWRNTLGRDGQRLAALRERAQACVDEGSALAAWMSYLRRRQRILDGPAGAVIRGLDAHHLPLTRLAQAFDDALFRSLVQSLYEESPQLAELSGGQLSRHLSRFRKTDEKLLHQERQRIANAVAQRPVTPGIGIGRPRDYTDRALLQYETGKKKAQIPLRDLMRRAGRAVRELKPCFMMSPVTVSQYLPREPDLFDVIIIDEASQVRPEDAFTCLVRGRQCVIVGDPKQLPPTAFFRAGSEDADEDDDASENEGENGGAGSDVGQRATGADDAGARTDLGESVLDLAIRAFRPTRTLRWHYRSTHSRLIRFSNAVFYDNRLVVFPGPHERPETPGVSLIPVAGNYRDRCNEPEVAAVLQAATRFMAEEPGLSLGIVALNSTQRERLQEAFDRTALGNLTVRRYIEKWDGGLYPFFIKNLENVQGDERDVIFISTVWAPEPGSDTIKLTTLGPLNRAGGARRLNVLFTRARREVRLFSSIDAGAIPADAASEGARVLRAYLAYAQDPDSDGPVGAWAGSAVEPPSGDSDGAFFRHLTERLSADGFIVQPWPGRGSGQLDLGVGHAMGGAGFLVGVESDGPAYQTALSVRDRERLRPLVLERLGWRLHRVWTVDWLADPTGCYETLRAQLEDQLASTTATDAADPRPVMDDVAEAILPGDEMPEVIDVDVEGGEVDGDEGDGDEMTAVGTAGQAVPILLPAPAAADLDRQPAVTDEALDEWALEDARPETDLLAPPPNDDLDPARIVAVGDTVAFVFTDRPGQPRHIRIVEGPDDPDHGIINQDKPLAVALLGTGIGERTTLGHAGNRVAIEVRGIIRPGAKSATAAAKTATAAKPATARDRSKASPSMIGDADDSQPAPYRNWDPTRRRVPIPGRKTPAAVEAAVRDIVATEGPLLLGRLCRLYATSLDYRRMPATLKAAIKSAVLASHRQGDIVIEAPGGNGPDADTAVLRLPRTPAVVFREIPPRTLAEVPPAELAEHLRHLRLELPSASREELFRECLRQAGGVRLGTELRRLLETAWNRL